MRSLLAGVLLVAAVMALVKPAMSAEDDLERARVHVRQATAAYNLGRYAEAAREYEAAYELTLDANMLFNVGQGWRQAGERQKAIIAYRSYLRTAPKGEQREVAEAKLKELDEQGAAAPAGVAPTGVAGGTGAPPRQTTSPTAKQKGAAVSSHRSMPPALAPAIPSWSPAASSEVRLETSPTPVDASSPRPFYRHWVFWTAVGAVVVAGAVTAVVLAGRGGDLAMPPTTYGAKRF